MPGRSAAWPASELLIIKPSIRPSGADGDSAGISTSRGCSSRAERPTTSPSPPRSATSPLCDRCSTTSCPHQRGAAQRQAPVVGRRPDSAHHDIARLLLERGADPRWERTGRSGCMRHRAGRTSRSRRSSSTAPIRMKRSIRPPARWGLPPRQRSARCSSRMARGSVITTPAGLNTMTDC